MSNTAFPSMYNGNTNNVRIACNTMTPVKPQDNQNAGPMNVTKRKNNKSAFHARIQNDINTATSNANNTKGNSGATNISNALINTI